MKKIDLTNQRFGHLLVLKDSGQRMSNKGVLWECQCDCGIIFIAKGYAIRKGQTISCPKCSYKYKQQKINEKVKQNDDLLNKVFGKLTVIDLSEKRNKSHSRYYKCKCECGSIIDVQRTHLLTGHTQSCGKCLLSKGEEKILQILQKNNIKFEQQKTFETCRFLDTNYLAKFDFYLPDYNLLIEYDGEQHFDFISTGNSWNNKNKFIKTQEHDNYKNQWAKKNNIKLKRIPYWDLDKINIEYILN